MKLFITQSYCMFESAYENFLCDEIMKQNSDIGFTSTTLEDAFDCDLIYKRVLCHE